MESFLIYYAPFLVIIGAITAAFWLALKGDPIDLKKSE
ncbi:cytochrome bd oxidase small subunit CydS [Peribacillus cavernae]|nr:hypothetical protein [Peribacillus cavernae]